MDMEAEISRRVENTRNSSFAFSPQNTIVRQARTQGQPGRPVDKRHFIEWSVYQPVTAVARAFCRFFPAITRSFGAV